MIKRIAYFFYYIKELDRDKLSKFINHVSEKKGKSKLAIYFDIVQSSLKYNISILEYFNFHFYEIDDTAKQTYAGTGYMYEYQLKMNPKDKRQVLEDKILFLKEYAPFVKHGFASLKDVVDDADNARNLLRSKTGKVVLKYSRGQCGNGVKILKTEGQTTITLEKALQATQNDYVEEFITQHTALMKLSPSGLNTIRIITQLNKNNEVDILGCRLRITVNSTVDNLAAGNIAAPIDEATGKVSGPGVYSDITKPEEFRHPITGTDLISFQVPFWNETMEMVTKAALSHPENRSIGWDVAITDNGPELIEGNHDWCKLLWQLPAKKGLKPMIEPYLKGAK